MNTLISLLLASIFVAISALHFYWLLGGRWAMNAVVPTKADSGQLTFRPPPIATLIVALGLLLMAWLSLAIGGLLAFPLSSAWLRGGMIGIAAIFALRAIGDFKYAGLSKKIKNTLFGRNDTRYYTPLCILIFTLSMVLLWLN
ncbi:MAG: DUF3995 domain-containing protein [Bacteroidota bacterium]